MRRSKDLETPYFLQRHGTPVAVDPFPVFNNCVTCAISFPLDLPVFLWNIIRQPGAADQQDQTAYSDRISLHDY
jgi:hypothetical protein